MTKLSKKEYTKQRDIIISNIDSMKLKLEALSKWADNLDYNNLTDRQRMKIDKIGDYWNGLHDKQREQEQELKFLEDRWDKRNWTYADHMSWELVISNID